MKQSLVILSLIPAWGLSFFVPTTRNGDNRSHRNEIGAIITTKLLLEKINSNTGKDQQENNYNNELWHLERVDKISDWVNDLKKYPNPLSLKPNIPLSWFVDDDAAVAAKVQVGAHETELEDGGSGLGKRNKDAFLLAGPRLDIAFDPKCCKAAIVTCGGLCPGLNTVVRELTMCLRRQYGVDEIRGIRSGYR